MQGSSILFVDDDADIRGLFEISLRRHGSWQVTVASSGREALALVEGSRPDVVVLDVSMPGMDGVSVFKVLRDSPATRDLPVIFLTAMSDAALVARLQAMGAAAVVGKPFDPRALAERIREVTAGCIGSRSR